MLNLCFSNYSKFMSTFLLVCFLGPLWAQQQTEKDAIKFTEILEAASFADVAYGTEAEISEFLQSSNYSLTQYHMIPQLNIAFFIATDDLAKKQIIAVRGTSNIENTMLDISLKLTPDDYTGIQLHKGFSLAAKQVFAEIQPVIKKDYQISTTGHSLGGAVALILAMYLDTDHFNVGQVITFGQPKVSNIAGTKKFEHLNLIRVVTPLDLVPLVPLFDPLDINNVDIYWHGGKEVLLLSDTQFAILEGIRSMLRATKFTQQVLNDENLKNHQMSFYIEKLDEKKSRSELVPFKNSFNLFNLFGS